MESSATSERPAKALKILLLNEFFWPDNQGGTATATSNIASRLRDQFGAEVTVITGEHAYREAGQIYPPFAEWDGIQIHRVSSPNWIREKTIKRFAGNLLFAKAVARKARELKKPDVILVTTAPLTLPIAARTLKKRWGVPYAYLIYDLDPDRTVALGHQGRDSKSVRLLRAWQRLWLGDASKVIAIGRCMKDHLVKNYRLSPAKVDVVEVGADPNVVRPAPKQTDFRRRNGLDGFVVLYSGNFGQYHDFDSLLTSAERLRDSEPDIVFVLVGGGHKRGYVEAMIQEKGLTNVRLMNFVPEEELADLLASADMLVVTLEPGMEGLCVPSKFYTCMAAGRPTLALMSAGTEVARVIEEEDCGQRVDIGDVDATVEAILAAKLDGQALEEQGRNARRAFEEKYSIDQVIKKLYQTLHSASLKSDS